MQKIYGIDALRTLALIGVLLYHTFPQTVPGGYFGVIVFFILSGFFTAYSTSMQPKQSVMRYYLNRFKRIYPALILMIFITVALVSFVDTYRLQNTQEEVLSILLGYNNYWQLSKQTDYFANLTNNSPFTHLWYLAILIQFELIWPWLMKLYRRLKGRLFIFTIFTFLTMLILPIRSFFPNASITVLYYATDTRIHALFLGALFGLIYAKGKLWNSRPVKPILSLIYIVFYVVISIIIYLKVPGTSIHVYRYGMLLYALFTCIYLTLCFSSRSRVAKLLENPIVSFLSKYSYEIYLWQFPILFLFGILKWNTGFFSYLFQIILILLVSIWTHQFVDLLIKRKKS